MNEVAKVERRAKMKHQAMSVFKQSEQNITIQTKKYETSLKPNEQKREQERGMLIQFVTSLLFALIGKAIQLLRVLKGMFKNDDYLIKWKRV